MEKNELSFRLSTPKKGCCSECATKHNPEEPHNKDSVYYQLKFLEKNGRNPTWRDAMEHCSFEVQQKWADALAKEGILITLKPQEECV